MILPFFYLLELAAVTGVYYLTAKLGLMLGAVSGFATFVWPPTGLALCVLFLRGYRLAPGVFLGAFLINAATGAPLLPALGMGVGNTAEALLGVYLLRRFAGFSPRLERFKDVLGLLVYAALISTTVSAAIGVFSLWLGGVVPASRCLVTARAWWVGDILGDLIVAPLFFVWSTRPRTKLLPGQWVELAWMGAALIIMGLFVFGTGKPAPLPIYPLVIWAALRFGPIGAVTTTFFLSGVAIWGTSKGFGPFVRGSLSESLSFLQTFQGVVAFTGMTLAAGVSELVAARKTAEEALRVRDEFLSIASHELKTPLTVLKIQVQMFQKAAQGSARQQLGAMDKQINRLTALIEDLLDVSRIQAGRMSLRVEPLDLSALIHESVERYGEQFRAAGCAIEVVCQPELRGHWDRTRLEQVFANLFSNAIKYAPGGPLKILAEPVQGAVKIVVHDSGPGIPVDKQQLVFERFERLDHAAHTAGLGLGLFIVREIVVAHGGRVGLESLDCRGSKFTIELPLVPRV